MKKKRILAFMLMLMMVLTLMPTSTVFAKATFPIGDGKTAETAFEILTLEQLKSFRDDVNSGNGYDGQFIKLAADIDLGGSDSNKWSPIGNSSSNRFNGTFDGNGKKITSLYTYTGGEVSGLFGYVNGNVYNLDVSGTVSGGNNIMGGIAGYNSGNIENCSFSGTVSGGSYVGGIAGYSEGMIKKCSNEATVTGSGYVGGIVGTNTWGTVSECYNVGKVTSTGNYAGGIVGRNANYLYNSYNNGYVEGKGKYVGGIVGYNCGSVAKCYNASNLKGDSEFIGSVAGYNDDDDFMSEITNCYYLSGTYEGGVDGVDKGTKAITKEEMKTQSTFAGWDFDTIWLIDGEERPLLKNNLEFTGSKNSPYTISTLLELEAFRDDVNGGNAYDGKYIKLMADIDLLGSDSNQWTPIGIKGNKFEGMFDGNGHEINGLYINNTTDEVSYQGLFGCIYGATIKNLTVDGSVGGKNMSWSGGIVGYADDKSVIENCCNKANVTTEYNYSNMIGGIAGKISGTTISGCYNIGDISGTNVRIGGIAGSGDAGSTVENCYNTGNVSTTYDSYFTYIGGIMGYMLGVSLKNSYNIGTVTATSAKENVGGAVGIYDIETITSVYYLDTCNSTGTTFDSDTKGEAKTSGQFKEQSTFVGWDFDTVWIMDDERPILRNNLEETGTKNYPYTISNLTQLEAFRDAVNSGNTYEGKLVKLTADIDMSSKYGDGKQSWTPIGKDSENPFKGTFDGNGHEVKNLYIKSASGYLGLFGWINGGTVENLGVSGSISHTGSSNSIGGVVAYSIGDVNIINCYNSCTISAPNGSYVGGIIGRVVNGTVQNCCNFGEINGNDGVGEIVGYLGIFTDSFGENCYFKSGASKSGVGQIVFAGTTNKIEAKTADEFASGEVAWLLQNGQATQVWGQTLTGDKKDSYPVLSSEEAKNVKKVSFKVKDSENEGQYKDFAVKYTNKDAKLGDNFPVDPDDKCEYQWSETADVNGTKFTKDTIVTKDTTVYGVKKEITEASDKSDTITLNKNTETEIDLNDFVKNKSGNTEKNFAFELAEEQTLPAGLKFDESTGKITGKPTKVGYYTVEFNVANNGISLMSLNNINGVDVLTLDIEVDLEGDGNESTPYQIWDLSDLEYFRDKVNGGTTYEGKHIKLMDNIDMSGSYGANVSGTEKSWDPISYSKDNGFKGTFDGNGKEIQNIYINDKNNISSGLFGCTGESVIKNLGVTGSITGRNDTGGIVSENNGTVENCYYKGTVSGIHGVGGIACNNYGTIRNCYSVAAVSGSENGQVGGITGRTLSGSGVTNCYYLDGCIIKGTDSKIGTAKTETEFYSGEVAWLLQNGQTSQLWGQKLNETDSTKNDKYPVLTSEADKKVYKVAQMANTPTGGDYTEDSAVYGNDNQTLTLNGYNGTYTNKFYGWTAEKNSRTLITEYTINNADAEVYSVWNELTFDVSGEKQTYQTGTARKITLTPKINGKANENVKASAFEVKYYEVNENTGKLRTTDAVNAISAGKYLYVISFAGNTEGATAKQYCNFKNEYTVGTSPELPDIDCDNVGYMLITSGAETAQKPISFKKGDVNFTLTQTEKTYKNDLNNTNNSTITYESSDEKIATVASDGTVSILKPGTVTITATSTKENTTPVYASYKLTIKKELTVSDFDVTVQEKTYDGTTNADISATLKAGVVDEDDDIRVNITGRFRDSNVKPMVGGVYQKQEVDYTITGIYGTGSEKYALSSNMSGTENAYMNKATVTFIASKLTTRTFDGSPQRIEASAMANGQVFPSGNYIITYGKVDDGGNADSYSETEPTKVGTYSVKFELTAEAEQNYTIQAPSSTIMLSIESAPQNVFFVEIEGTPEAIYYGDSFTLVSSGAMGDVTYTSSNSDILAITGENAVAKGVGKVTITATSQKDGYDNKSTTKTIDVKKRVLTPSVTATNKTYDGTNAVTVSVTLKNIVNSDDITASATGTMVNADAGKDKIVYVSGITLFGDKKDCYALSTSSLQTSVDIEKRKITSFTFESEDKTYDKTDVAVAKNIVFEEATAGNNTGLLSADDGQITLIGSAKYENATDGNAGSYYVSYTASGLTGTKAHNYELDLSDDMKTNEKYEIEKMDVEFSIGQTTFVYDGNKKEITATAKDEKGNKFTEFEISYNKDPINVGDDYTATIEIKNGNYKTSQETVKITIEEADQNNLVITGLPGTVQYKQNDIVLKAVGGVDCKDATYKWTSDNENVTFDDDESATPKITINGAVGERVEIKVTKSVSNYSDISASTAFVPTAKSVVFDITNLEQTYKDGKTVKITPNDSDVTQSDYTVTYNGKDTVPTNAGTYIVKVEAKGNYTGTQTATLVIGKASLKGDIEFVYEDSKTKYVYGDKVSAKATNVTQDDNDEITAKITYVGTGIYVEQTEAPKKAGNYAVKLTISGKNYETLTKAEEFVIEKAPLKVWVNNVSRAYGEANPVFTINYEGFVNGEDKSVLLAEPVATTTANASSPVKNYDIVVSGGSAENYQFDYVTGEGKNTLTVTGATGGNLYITGASGTVGVGQIFTLSAFYGNTKIDVKWSSSDPDVVSIDEKTGVVTAKKASSKTVTITATADENYANKTATFDLNVEKASVILTAKDTVKTYNGEEQYITIVSSNPNFVPSASNVEVTYTLTTNSEVHSPTNVGTYAVNFVITDDSYTGGGNATMYINKATVTAKVKDDTKVYGDEYTGYDIEITNNGGITNETALAEVIVNIKSATSFASDGAVKTAVVKEGGYEMIPTLSKTETDNVKFSVEKGTLTVTKAPLTIKVKDVTREYGAENPTLEAEYTGFKNDETTDVLKGELVLSYDESINAETAVGEYKEKAIASGLTADNYDISYDYGDVVITKVKVTAFAGVSKTNYLTVNFDKALKGLTKDNFVVKNGEEPVEITSVYETNDGKTYTLNGIFQTGVTYTVTPQITSDTHEIISEPLSIEPTRSGSSSNGSSGGSSGGGSAVVTTYTVKFETNGGSEVDSVKVEKNKTLTEPTAPTKDGYAFDGWYTDKKLTKAYDFTTKVTKAFTLYAKWTEKKVDDNKDDNNKTSESEWKNPFTDVKENDWFFESVKYANENGLMSGITNDTFAPNDTLTRGMLVTVLYRAEGETAVNNSIAFSDVKSDMYYANAVNWAQQNGIVNGVTENEFAPDENITREQMATIIYRYAKFKGVAPTGAWAIKLDYADVNEISDYALEGVMYCTLKGIMQGKANNMFAPKDNATRAETATILQRFIDGNK